MASAPRILLGLVSWSGFVAVVSIAFRPSLLLLLLLLVVVSFVVAAVQFGPYFEMS